MPFLIQEQFLPMSLEAAWDFFATPRNLNEITPPDMSFEITSTIPERMYPGLLITYKIKPMLNIPLDWVTEISHIREHEFFVDEQRKGPYKIWHHEHHFREVVGGVLMTDRLYYEVGKSIFGWIAAKVFVDQKVKQIFKYRYQLLEKRFSNRSDSQRSIAHSVR